MGGIVKMSELPKELKCVVKSCLEKRSDDCCYGMCLKHCSDKYEHYVHADGSPPKYPNLRRRF